MALYKCFFRNIYCKIDQKNYYLMKNNLLIFITILFFNTYNILAQEKLVANISEYNEAIKVAKAGDVLILKNGVWKDVEINAFGTGTKELPIIIKAETAGKVIITGNSTLNIYGDFIIVSGLWFKDGYSTYKSVVQFKKNAKLFANNCRLTNSTISYYKVTPGVKDHWVDIWGKNNRVDHNNFTGKTSAGTTLVVWLKGDEHIENNHRIDNNLFGFREELGENGGETIRIGTSTNSMKSSKTLVERNVFASCNGEIEIISNKSGDNIFRDNLFVGSKGTLTLRHGNNALVERNVFLGNSVSKTGGIRVINSGHIIKNNLLIGLQGEGYRGSIVLMNGVLNSPLNRYHQVKNVDIQNNTIINSGPIVFGAGKDDEKTLAPENVNFSNNLIFNNKAANNVQFLDAVSGINFNTNYIDATDADIVGFIKTKINWKELKNYPIPTKENQDLLKATKNNLSPVKDITRKLRSVLNVGAFNLGSNRLPIALSLRAGPGWKPKIVAPKVKKQEILVKPGVSTLEEAIKNATKGAVLKLEAGEFLLKKKIKITNNIKITGAQKGVSVISVSDDVEKQLDYIFRVNEGATLKLSNVTLNGEVKSPKYAIVSPNKQEGGLYNVYVNNVTFKNFNNKNGGSVFKAYNGTLADTLSFKNSKFEDNYRGLNLSYDKDIIGKINANNIILQNTIFKNIEGEAVNYIRKIPTPEIPGGNLVVNNCVFSKVNNKEKGQFLKTNGIHKVEISNSVFEKSYKIKVPLDLKGSKNLVSNCLIYTSGFVKVSKNAKKVNLIYKNPKWENQVLFIPSEKSELLKKNNKRAHIGLKSENF